MIIHPTQDQGDAERRDAEALSQAARRPPAAVPGYEIEEPLGEGAFGEVWLALDQNTGVRVAIKFYTHRGRSETSALAAEVQKMAFLFGDRHIIQLIDVGWESEPPYFVMEYLPRGSLEARLRDGPLPVEEAEALIRDVAVGLVHAHGKGIFHCDLKPANVLLDGDGRPRLADFGQSRLSSERAPALGTLFYMAPEQADLKAVPDARWDVYALGALLHHMLTGHPPLSDVPETTAVREAATLEERLASYRRLVRSAPRPAGHRRLVDRALAEVVDRCLAPEPSRRFPNPQAVLEAIDARTLWRARRPLLALAAIVPALLLMLVLAYFADHGFNAAVAESQRALVAVSRVNTQAVARLAADRVAESVALRWFALRRVAADPAFRERLAAAAGRPAGDPARRALQRALWDFHWRYNELPAHSWNVFDATGVQLAATTFDPTNTTFLNPIGKDFSYRDYFHGMGADVAPGTPTRPLRAVHRSITFRGTASKAWLVCLSVPVWAHDHPGPDDSPLGVLVMIVKVGAFADFLPQRSVKEGLVVALIDTKRDGSARANLVCGHPFLTRWLRDGKPPEQMPRRYLEAAPRPWDEAYEDPFRRDDPQAYGPSWLAAGEAVRVEMPAEPGGPAEARDLGFAVVVQQDQAAVIRPVASLKQNLTRWGRWALGWVVLMLAALCAFLAGALSGRARSRLTAFLRRRAGLATAGGSGSLGRPSARPSPDGRTQAVARREHVRAEVLDTARSRPPGAGDQAGDAGAARGASASEAAATVVASDPAPPPAGATTTACDWSWPAATAPLPTEDADAPPPARAWPTEEGDRWEACPRSTETAETGGEPWPT
jgi:eukaryotic-like serine/threonine-protein kinase